MLDSIGLGEFMVNKSYFIIGSAIIFIVLMYILKVNHFKLKKEQKIILKVIIWLCLIVFLFNLFSLSRVIYLLTIYGI